MLKPSNALLLGLFGLFGLAVYAPKSLSQVWVEESQLGGRVPGWVDKDYYQPAVYQLASRQVWCEPVYRTVMHRVWRDAVYTTTVDRIWVEGHYEIRHISVIDPCGCTTTREERIWVAGHSNCVERKVMVRPGCSEEVAVRELITPGRWETVSQVSESVLR